MQCIEIGIETAHEQIAEGADLVACGDMGIGNTTPSSAITSVITGADPEVTTGRGAGIDDSALDHKVDVIKRSIEVNQPDASDGLDVLAKVGGFEIGVLAGAMLGTASRRRPVVVDGLISRRRPDCLDHVPMARHYFIASHQSVEPGHQVGLDAMGLRPLLDLGMRLGEGTGAALAIHLVDAAARCLAEMATFAEAGVSERSKILRTGMGEESTPELIPGISGLPHLVPCLVSRGPAAQKIQRDISNSRAWFPLVGLLIGFLLVLVQLGASQLFSGFLTAAVLLFVLSAVTRALHLDGLMDVCDGIFGGHTPERRLEIMKDPHVGAFGVVGLVLILLLKFGALVSLNSNYFFGVNSARGGGAR